MEIINDFRNYLLKKNISNPTTLKNYLSDLRHFISWYEKSFGIPFEPSELEEGLIKLYEGTSGASLSAGGIVNHGEKMSRASIKRRLSSLRQFARFAVENQYIEENPFTELSAISSQLSAQDIWHIAEFKDYLKFKKASELTVKNYVTDIHSFRRWYESAIEPHVGNVSFPVINDSIIEEYKKRLIDLKSSAPRTVNRKLSSIRKYVEFAIVSNYTNKDFFYSPTGVENLEISKEQAQISATLSLNDIEEQKIKIDYSPFPPIRLFQRLIVLPYILAESAIAERIITLLYGSKALGFASKKINSSLPRIKIPQKVSDLLKIKGYEKSFYAPNEVSLDYYPFHKKLWHYIRFTRPHWYKKYHSLPVVHYIHFAILIVFCAGVGIALYRNLVTDQTPLFAAPVSPPRILSFQGRLTDNLDNPITAATDLRFAIYNDLSASGAALLWQEVHYDTNLDQDGIFSVLLGTNTAIPDSVFFENDTIYLGVTIEQTAELAPRRRIASVPYAANSESLQGMLPITDGGAGTTNVVLALDSSGDLTIGGAATPTFSATGGQFALSGTVLLLTTNTGTNSDVIISPDGIGKIDVQKPLVNTTATGNLTPGGVEVNDKFGVLATESAVAAFIVNNNTAGGDIFTASSSGTPRFTIENDGILRIPVYNTAGGIFYANGAGGLVAQTSAGSGGQCLQSAGGATPTWGTCGSGALWRIDQGAISPINDTLDLLVGASATTSAKFAVLNVGNGTPVASISAISPTTALALSSDGSIQTVRNNTLTIGGNTTGNIILNPLNGTGRVGINTSSPLVALDVRGSSGTTAAATISANTSFAVLTVDNSGVGDLFAASASGVPNFVIKNNGDIIVGQGGVGKVTAAVIDPYLVQNQYTTGNTQLTFQTMAASNGDFIYKNQSTTLATLVQAGQLQLPITGSSGGLAIGADTQLFRGSADRLDLATGDSFNVVSGNYQVGGVTIIDSSSNATFNDITINGTCSGCVSTGNISPFQELATGAIVPNNSTVDFLIGGQATTSAKFAVLNVDSGTPVASISAISPTTALALSSDGSIQTVRNNTLTIGGNTTGDILLNSDGSNFVGIGHSAPTSALDVLGNVNIRSSSDSTDFLTISNNATVTTLARSTNGGTLGSITLDSNGTLTAENLTVTSITTLSSFASNGGVLYTNGSGVVAQATAGTGTQCLLGGTTPTFGSCGTGITPSPFQELATGAIVPNNSTVDFLIGGQATTSAKFAVLNIDNGTPTASVSATAVTDRPGLYMTGTGTLSSVNKGTLTIGSSDTGNIVIGTDATARTVTIGNSTGATALTLNSGTGAINIGTSIAKTITIGNTTTSTALALNSGTGGIALASTSTGDITLNSSDTLLLDSAGVLELNSSAGVISIGNDAVAQNINLGTGGAARTITIGNVTGATAVNVNAGTGGSTITTTGAGDFTVASGDDVTINGAGASAAISIGTSAVAHTIGIGNTTGATAVTINSGTGAINIGTSIAKTLTIGNTTTTTALNFDTGTGGINFGDNANTKTIDIGGVTNSGTDTINIATNGTAADVISIGNANAATTVAITGGNDWSITAGGVLTVASCTGCSSGTGGVFQELAGAIVPNNSTVDFLIGGQATTSAKFAVLNVGNGTPVASISAISPTTALALSSDGSIQTVRNNTLTIGGNTSGLLVLKSLNNTVFKNPGTANIFVGANAGASNTGTHNSFFGFEAGFSNTSGGFNLFIGDSAGYANTIGSNNMFIGVQAGSANVDGANNLFLGNSSGLFNVSGGNNTFFGESSGRDNTASNNSFFGNLSGQSNTSGTGNVFMGYLAGDTGTGANANTTGNYNTFIGYQSGPGTTTQLTNAAAFGKNALVSSSNSLVLGGTGADAVQVGIGIQSPIAALDIRGGQKGGNAALIVSQTGSVSNDIFTASSSSTTRFTINNAGAIGLTSGYGSAGECLQTSGSGSAAGWGTCGSGGGGVFQELAGAIVPNNSTVDFLIGGQATTSAKFAVLNIDSGTPTASVSAGTAGGAYLNATGTLATTAKQTLTLGTSTTGEINIGTDATARVIGIGNTTGATALALNSGTGGIALASTSTGDITLNSSDTLLLDSAGVLELNSSAGVISIGNDAVAQNINLGTGGAARTITIGNSTGATALNLDTGTGGLTIATAGTERVVVDSNGRLQIGTSTAPANLDLNPFVRIYNSASHTDPAASISAKTTSSSLVITNDGSGDLIAASVSGSIKFAVRNNGDILFTGTTIGPGADFAEYYKKSDPNEIFEAGMLVCQSENSGVTKCDGNNPSHILLGAISDNPLITGGGDRENDPNYVLVGLVGQLKVRVAGDIRVGDPLTISGVTGIAVKATNEAVIIGYAMESNNNGTKPRVASSVQKSYYNPNLALNYAGDDSETFIASLNINDVNGKWRLTDAFGNVVNRTSAFSNLVASNIKVGFINAQKITTNAFNASSASISNLTAGVINGTSATIANISSTSLNASNAVLGSVTIGSENVVIAGISLRDYIASVATEIINDQAPIFNGNEIISPIASIDEINTNIISPLADGASIEIEVKPESIAINNTNTGEKVVDIDNEGNARFAGDLEARRATFSGTLSSETLETNNASISGNLATDTLQTNDATISGTLSADRIIANTIDGLDDRISSVASSLIASNQSNTSSSSAISYHLSSISDLEVGNLYADFGIYSQGLSVLGSITTAQLTAMDSIAIGTGFILTDNSINTLGATLEIQPLRQGNISFMAGRVKIDTDGNVDINGNLNLAGIVNANEGVFNGIRTNSLATNIISPLPDSDLVIQLGNNNGASTSGSLKIANANGDEVLKISGEGNIVASGSATFDKLNFNLVGEALADSDLTATATGSAGFATVQRNKPEVTIYNDKITKDSLIYITPFGDTQNKVLHLLRQVPQSETADGSFTVGISGTPATIDIQFNWLIVN